MGVVPAKRRGIAAGARTLLQNTGAVLSIAFVLAIVTSADPESDAVRGLLRPRQGPLRRRSSHPSSPTCTPRCGCSRRSRCSARSCACCGPPRRRRGPERQAAAGTAGSPRAPTERGRERTRADAARSRRPPAASSCASATSPRLVGTTPRTIRYYEELGLLPEAPAAALRQHRLYTPGGGRAPARGHAPEGAARRVAGGAEDAAQRRGGARRGARPAAARGRRRRAPPRAAGRGARAPRPPARAGPPPRRRARPSSSTSCSETRKRVKRKIRELERDPRRVHAADEHLAERRSPERRGAT